MRGCRIPLLLGIRNHLNNSFDYKRRSRSSIRVKLASRAYLELRIIKIIIMHVTV